MDRKLLDYFPEVVRVIREIQNTAEAEQPEIESLWDCLANALDDQFVPSATENGVSRWEDILEIVPKGTDTLDERKFRITARMTEKLPYTWRRLEWSLSSLCGEDGYSLELSNEECTVRLRVALISKKNYDSAKDMAERMLPANMILDILLLYNQHKTIHGFTHRRLHGRTQSQIRNEVLS